MAIFKRKRSISFFLFFTLMWSLIVPSAFADGTTTGGAAGSGAELPTASINVKVMKNGLEVDPISNPLLQGDTFSLVILGSDIARLYGYSIDFQYDPSMMSPAPVPFTTNGAEVFSDQSANYQGSFTALDHYPDYHQNTLTIIEHLVETDNDPTTTVSGVNVSSDTILGTLNFVANTSDGDVLVITGNSLAQLGVDGVNLTVALADDTPEIEGQSTTQPIPYQIPAIFPIMFGQYVPAVEITEPAHPDHTSPVVGKQFTVAGTAIDGVTDVELYLIPRDESQSSQGVKVSDKIPVSNGTWSTSVTLPDQTTSGDYILTADAYKGTEFAGGTDIYITYQAAQYSVTVDDVGTKKQGEQVVITGTTNLSSVDIKVLGPDQNVVYTATEAPVSNGQYSHTYTLGFEAPLGTYTVVVGQNGVEASDTFEVVDGIAPGLVTFSPAGGTYSSAQKVSLSAETGATIYFTTDGTDPTTLSMDYSSPINVSSNMTIKAIAVDAQGNASQVATAEYVIETTPQDTTPPALVTNLQATATDHSVTLTWNPNSETDLESYRIYQDGQFIGDTKSATYSVNGLNPSTSYTFGVSAVDSSNNESEKATVSITTEPTPDTTHLPVASLTTADNSLVVGDEFVVKLNLNSLNDVLISADANIPFDNTKLEYLGPDAGIGYETGAVVSSVDTSNRDGEVVVSFANTGVDKSSADIVGLRFKAKNPGNVVLLPHVTSLGGVNTSYTKVTEMPLNLNIIQGYWYDVNGDGKVQAYDAALILRYNVKLESTKWITNDISKAEATDGYWYDVNGDGKVQAYDAALILRYNVKLETTPNVWH